MDATPSPFSSSTPFPKPPLNPFLSFLLLLLLLSSFPLLSLAAFVPADNYLLACGATAPVAAADGRLFLPDSSANPTSLSASRSSPLSSTFSSYLSPLLRSTGLFPLPSSYSFPLSPSSSSTGLLLRLYFLPFPHPSFNLSSAQFSVSAAGSFILHRFSPTPSPLLKEFFLKPPLSSPSLLLLSFSPSSPSSFAFINAIELLSAPANLFPDAVTPSPSPLLPLPSLSPATPSKLSSASMSAAPPSPRPMTPSGGPGILIPRSSPRRLLPKLPPLPAKSTTLKVAPLARPPLRPFTALPVR